MIVRGRCCWQNMHLSFLSFFPSNLEIDNSGSSTLSSCMLNKRFMNLINITKMRSASKNNVVGTEKIEISAKHIAYACWCN